MAFCSGGGSWRSVHLRAPRSLRRRRPSRPSREVPGILVEAERSLFIKGSHLTMHCRRLRSFSRCYEGFNLIECPHVSLKRNGFLAIFLMFVLQNRLGEDLEELPGPDLIRESETFRRARSLWLTPNSSGLGPVQLLRLRC